MKKLLILVALLLGLTANLQAGSISPPIVTTGVTGPRGGFGGDSQPYTYSSTTTDADPGSGNLRFDNATLASATKAYIDLNNSDGTTVTAWLDALDDSTSTVKGTVRFFKKSDQSVFAVYQLAANTTASGYRKLNLTYVTGNGSFTNGEAVVATFARQGDLGATGAAGPTGPTGATGAAGAAGTQVVLKATVTLTDAQIRALLATPITIVTAPGAGKALLVHRVFSFANTIAGSYGDNGGSPTLHLDLVGWGQIAPTNAAGTNQFFVSNFFAGVESHDSNLHPIVLALDGFDAASLVFENAALILKNGGDVEWAGGNAGNHLTVTVFYSIVDF